MLPYLKIYFARISLTSYDEDSCGGDVERTPKNLFLINLCAKMFTLDLLEKGPINGLVHL